MPGAQLIILLVAMGITPEERNRELAEENRSLTQEVAQLRMQLSACQGELQARERLAQPATREEGIKEAGRMLAGFYRWVATRPETKELSARQQRTLLGLHGAMMEAWAGKNPSRRLLIRDAQRWMQQHLDDLARRIEIEEQASIRSSPAVLLKELEESDRAKLASRIAEHVGTPVSWQGKITRLDDGQVELFCDGVLVVATLRAGYQAAGLKINTPVQIRGEVKDISGNPWVGVVVELEGAQAAAEPLKHGGGNNEK